MKDLSVIISSFFPEETILNQQKVRVAESFTTKVGNIPLGWSKRWNLFPEKVIETDKRIYFDNRVQVLANASIQLIVGPVLFISFIFIIYHFSVHQTVPPQLIIIAIIFSTIFGMFNLMLAPSLSNIYFVNKEWLKDKQIKDKKVILQGEIPENKNYKLVYEIPQLKMETLSLFDKIYTGLLFKKDLKPIQPFSVPFTIKYNQQI